MGHNTFIHNTTHSLRRCWWIRHLELADKERKWGKATQWRKEEKCLVRQRAGRKWQEKPKHQKWKKKQKATYELGSQRRRWVETAVGNVLLSQLIFSNVSILHWQIEQDMRKMCLNSSFSGMYLYVKPLHMYACTAAGYFHFGPIVIRNRGGKRFFSIRMYGGEKMMHLKWI